MPPHTRLQSKFVLQGGNDETPLDPTSQLTATRAELATLQERYDALHADRDRLAYALEMNMIKYKRFKRWVFAAKVKVPPKATPKDKDRAEQCGGSLTKASQQHVAINMLGTPITPKKPRSTRASAIRSPPKYTSPRRSPLSLNKHILNTPRKMRISSDGSPSTNHLKRPRDENEDIATEMSQTQEDSQALTFWQPSTPSQRERTSNLSPMSSSPTPKRSLALQSPPSTKRPRRSAGLAPEPASRPLPAISRYKRARSVEPPALNAEFEIDSRANAGVPFAFDEVVRGRRHRHALNSGECEECREWYTAVGPLPPRLEAPQWSSPSRLSSLTLVASQSASHSDGDLGEGAAAGVRRQSASAGVSAHRQAVSRHRAQWERAPTPPGYWDIGFPDTQAVEKINEKAAEIHRQKRAAVAKEAEKGGGRYRRRAY